MSTLDDENKAVLGRYTYEDDTDIKSRIFIMNRDNTTDNISAINEIVLWKLNRSIHISEQTILMLNSLDYLKSPMDVVNDKTVYRLIEDLLSSKGIKLAVASTILHFYYPNIFLLKIRIIDILNYIMNL